DARPRRAERIRKTRPHSHAWLGFKGCAIIRRMQARLLIAGLVLSAIPLDAQAPPAPSSSATSSVYISADEIAQTLQQSIRNNVVDQPVKAMDVVAPSSHRASLALLRRTKEETTALVHERVTEIYQIVEGAGTLVTGGTLSDPKPTDLTRLNAG